MHLVCYIVVAAVVVVVVVVVPHKPFASAPHYLQSFNEALPHLGDGFLKAQ